MLFSCRSHAAFQDFLRGRLPPLYYGDPPRLRSFSAALARVWLLDLDPAIHFLLSRYSHRGRPAFDPVDLLRSLVLMVFLEVFSITRWAEKLRSDRILAILSGFAPGKTPAVGTFYSFFHRLWLQDQSVMAERRLKLRAARPKPRGKLKSGEKLRPKHPGIVKKLVKRAILGRTFSHRPEWLIQWVFARCFVDQSVDLGLIPDPMALILSGDGTSIRSGSSPHGVKVCVCKKQGVYRCHCLRRFSDPDANWGWDSYREEFFYGYTGYSLTAAASQADLPFFTTVAQASRHDSVQGVVALAQFRELHPKLAVAKGLWDSAHDVQDFYRLHREWGIEPFISLNAKSLGQTRLAPAEMGDDGTPRCPAGIPMVRAGLDRARSRLRWRCPAASGKKAVCATPCSPSAYGRTVYTKPPDDPRLHPKTPRESEAWKTTFAKRSGSERLNKRSKWDYGLERYRVKSKEGWFWLSHLVNMNQHLDAWVKLAEKNGFKAWERVLSRPAVA